MNSNELDKIELYAQGKLSPEENITFEQRMQDDKDFREYVKETLILINGINQYGRDILKSKLGQYEKNIASTQSHKTIYNKFWGYAAAASVLLLIASFFLYQQLSRQINPQDLYAEHFIPYPNVVVPINREDSINGKIPQTFQLYENKKYNEALIQFDALPEITTDTTLLFYKAITLMALNNTQNASVILKNIASKTHFRQQVLWYLALCAINNNELTEAKRYLLLLQQEFPKYKDTNSLLKQINNLNPKL